MEIFKEDYEQGVKMVQAQLKDAVIQSMLAENTLKFLRKKAEEAKPAPKKDGKNLLTGP